MLTNKSTNLANWTNKKSNVHICGCCILQIGCLTHALILTTKPRTLMDVERTEHSTHTGGDPNEKVSTGINSK